MQIGSITAWQIADSMLAIPCFIPLTVCTGYLAGWLSDLHGFRQKSTVERLFWSVPLSLAVSTITSVLLGWFISLLAAEVFLIVCACICVVLLIREWFHARQSKIEFQLGFNPLGGVALAMMALWIAVIVLSLVDFQSNDRLHMSLTAYDHAPRTNWTDSVIRTGVPPANPLYWYKQAAPMRYYYFWLVDCAAVASISQLPTRAVLIAGSLWALFSLAALSGLMLKYFLAVGERLRRQFVLLVSLLFVSGLTICLYFHNMLILHVAPPGDLPALVQIVDWQSYFLFYAHHVNSLVCCMTAFLLASMSPGKQSVAKQAATILLISAALASAFGLSVYVTFAFFLVAIVWAIWQIYTERKYRPVASLFTGGAGSIVLLLPYLWQLTQTTSKMGGGRLFSFSVRETLPADWLLSLPIFKAMEGNHPAALRNIANLILLVPGYVIELGLPVLVLLVFLIPAWRSRVPLTRPQRSLVVIAVATIPIMSFIRSGVLTVNDFGLHSALFLQYPLLLLSSEFLVAFRTKRNQVLGDNRAHLLGNSPRGLRFLAAIAISVGVLSTAYKAFDLRFFLTFYGAYVKADLYPHIHDLSHKAYISQIGYRHLNQVTPRDAITQFNPAAPNPWWQVPDMFGINRQAAAVSDQLWCGSEIGGDPSGCPAMAADIDALYKGTTKQQAHAICRQYSIQYLVANIYDPAWQDRQSWVWTLNPVVADPEFRALDCR